MSFSTIPAIKHLFEIGRKMLRAKRVPRSHDAALEQAEGGVCGIGMNVANDIDVAAVPNRLVVLGLST